MPDRPSSTASVLLGGRYRLQGEIARGGMASVFRAHDEVLGRTVAVKLLHPHLVDDRAFLDRFRREARAAAALSHPNVVAVFDWGHDENGPYLVMELLEGESLREVLNRHGRITPAEALDVLGPAANGLAAAHRRGFVHRDVKPENVIVTRPGDAKVTDFGLARAVAVSTQTFGNGVLVGTPHYLAPEAVRGDRVGPPADVYALGIVLFECLTGRRPFEGETPHATALRHTTATVPSPSSVVRGTSRALDGVVARATAPDPRERYPDAAAFGAALRLAVAQPNGAHGAGRRDTLVIPTAATDTVVAGRPAAPPRPPDGARVRPKRRPRRRLLPLITLLVVLAAGLIGWAVFLAPLTAVPSVRGTPVAAAVEVLRDAGFVVELASEPAFSNDVAEGLVTIQDPTGRARRGTTVNLVESRGPRVVPTLVGMTWGDEAAARLTEFGVADTEVRKVWNDALPPGVVIGTQPPPGTRIGPRAIVVVTVSAGREPIDGGVPAVVGLRREQAERRLQRNGLVPTVEEVFANAPSGEVIAQAPEAEQPVFRGDGVTLTVSKGQEILVVPNVRGAGREQAEATITDAGFVAVVDVLNACFLAPSGAVREQVPPPDTQAARGSEVTVFVCP